MARAIPALVIVVLLACLPTSTVDAQSEWLEQARELWQGFGGNESTRGVISKDEISAGLKEALRIGTHHVVVKLGALDGFNTDPWVHIPLPDNLQQVQSTLAKVGMSAIMDDLELRLNRAAEAATPKAKKLFLDSIGSMGLDDVRRIYEGSDDAATRYFRSRMSQPLARQMIPIVNDSLSQVGAIRVYDEAINRYQAIPFVPDVKADLSGYVVEKGMDGIFFYLAREEAAIRRDPARRTSELLRKVFGTRTTNP